MLRATLPLAVLWLALGASLVAQTSPVTLAHVEKRALANNPTLAQAQSQIETARGLADQAGRWPNPSIGYTAEEVSNSATIRGGEHGFFVEQVFPLGGKLRLSRAIYEREADAAEAVNEAQRLRVLNAVRGLFYAALAAERRVEVRERLADLTTEAIGVSAQLANVGAADQTDLLESEIEAQRARLALVEAQSDQRRVWSILAQVVGDPSLTRQPLAGDLEADAGVPDEATVLDRLLRDSPEIRAADARVERARAALARERKEPVPDLVVRAGPRYNRELLDPGPRPVGWEAFADVGVTIPLFDRNQGGVRAAQAELVRAEEDRRRVELALRARLSDVFERYAVARARAETLGSEIVPRAARAHELLLARYQEMAAAYPQVLIAQRRMLQATDEYLEAVAARWREAVLLDGLLLEGGLDAPPTARDSESPVQ